MSVRAARRLFLGALAALFLAASPQLVAEEKKDNPAARPINRDNQRHKQFLERAKKGDIDVLFLGDSITQGWEGAGKDVWKMNFEPLKAANFGIGGDQTGHVLWRITEGKELEGISPKVAVLMIGTNNMGGHSAEDIAGGIKAIVEELRKQKPDMKILLLGIFPRSPKAADKVRDKIKDVNARIAKLDDGKSVFYLDIGEKFLDKDGALAPEIMPDYLHLSPQGYKIWADAITPTLEKLLKK
jgi:lysophospholipase L1-like esterase